VNVNVFEYVIINDTTFVKLDVDDCVNVIFLPSLEIFFENCDDTVPSTQVIVVIFTGFLKFT